MAEENVEIVQSNYDHLNQAGEPDPVLYAPTLLADASRLPGFGVYRSLDGFVDAWRSYRDTFDEWWIEVEELLAGDEGRVFAAVRDGGRMKASGDEVRQPLFHVWELRDAKIVAWTVFLDRAEALEAAGLST